MSVYYQGALEFLLRGHELELVVCVGRLLGARHAQAVAPYVNEALRYLAYRAVRLGLPEIALDLAKAVNQVWSFEEWQSM